LTVRVVVVVSSVDPVADAVAKQWGTLVTANGHVDGTPLRRLSDTIWVLRRPGPHIHDEELDRRLPREVLEARPTLVFPSIHRSERNVASLTVHPLGNPGPSNEMGGRPRTLVPTDPLRMVSALRRLDELSRSIGLPSTYEATHHGPLLGLPAFFMEVGSGKHADPAPDAVRVLAKVIPELDFLSKDRVALGVGGGHYVPHFTELALERQWAFGHLLSRHALDEIDRATAFEAYARSERAEGIVYSRARDAEHPALQGIGPRLRDQDAPPRERGDRTSATDDARSASGT
jgi:D-aminoacyl-tRNA deacylase